MNFPDMIYNLSVYFFSNLWTYIGLLLLIITIRGDITKALSSVSGFFRRVMLKFKERATKEDLYEKQKRKVV